ncbi:hypothetical protein MSAN_02054400 [Mycena sanguinolenta]|uniref:Uncharacterized protein n=1 Tax=Mycena sanguinolenta TaxID=230812 RepID=A0A8H7CKY9_9AGAR|nr:hypothetical protein MSAN_02054400 [Mycena sanguinolenta]
MYYYVVPPSPWPPNTPIASPSTPTPLYTQPNYNAADEARFAEGIFDDVLNVTPGTSPRPSRAQFQWPIDPSVEERLLVAFRCLKQVGFETIGDFLAAVLDPTHKHQKVLRSVTAFLQCQGSDPRTHPISIIQRIFEDPRSKKHPTADRELHLDLPRHALPPSQRLLPELPAVPHNNTHNACINWALRIVLSRLKTEAKLLLEPRFGFTRERRRDEPGEKFSWSDVLGWSMTKNQEIISINAPAIFACLTTIAVSDEAQKKLAHATGATVSEAPTEPHPTPNLSASAQSDDEDSETEYEPEKPLDDGVPEKMRRDPWLVHL